MRPSFRSNTEINCMSVEVSSKSKTSRLLRIRSGVTDFGITTVPQLHVPTQDNRSRRSAMHLCDGLHGLVTEDDALTEGAPRFGDDAQFIMNRTQMRLREPRVQLDLIEHRRLADCVDKPLQVLCGEVRLAY